MRTGTTTIAELQLLSELQQNEILSKEIEIEKTTMEQDFKTWTGQVQRRIGL